MSLNPRSAGWSRKSKTLATSGFTEEQAGAIADRYLSGESTWKISCDFDVSDGTIAALLKRDGIELRPPHKMSLQGAEICRRYSAGESMSQLAKAFGVCDVTISRALKRHGVNIRKSHPQRRRLSSQGEAAVCQRYLAGESCPQLAKSAGVSVGCIYKILVRGGIERRRAGGFYDSIQKAIDSIGLYGFVAECEFYLYELARYSNSHCKPGIAFDTNRRVSQGRGEYGSEALRLVFATRAEAYFLEQAVLDATRASAGCPDDLANWDGASEVRAMPADDMAPIVLRLAAELEAMGPWAFAAKWVPMSVAQRATCQHRGLLTD
jgi:hypothetical protein